MSSDPSAEILGLFFQRQALSYLAIATASLLAFDILLGLFQDIRILSKHTLKLADLVYILSRLVALGVASTNGIFSISPINSCIQQPALLAMGIFSAILIPCNSWLFLLRIRAIPPQFRSQTTVVICTILWLSTFTSFLALPAFTFSSQPTHEGRCGFKINAFNRWLVFTPYVTLIVFDTTTMIAILAGFAMHSPDSSWVAKIKSVISIKHMGHLSGVFVRSGLIYYLATIGIHLSLLVIVSSFTVPSSIIGELSVLVSIFHNIMTCRVFRLLKLEAFHRSSFSLRVTHPIATGTIVFQHSLDE